MTSRMGEPCLHSAPASPLATSPVWKWCRMHLFRPLTQPWRVRPRRYWTAKCATRTRNRPWCRMRAGGVRWPPLCFEMVLANNRDDVTHHNASHTSIELAQRCDPTHARSLQCFRWNLPLRQRCRKRGEATAHQHLHPAPPAPTTNFQNVRGLRESVESRNTEKET